MNNNINNFPCLIELGNNFYQCDFDIKSIDILETVTGLGFYEIYDSFVFQNNLSCHNTIDLISVSAYKYHGSLGMQKVKSSLIAHPEIDLNNLATLKIHFKNLLPDLLSLHNQLNLINPDYIPVKSSSQFFNFEENYALAMKILNWSDSDFWSATPKKLYFSLISILKYNKETEKFQQKTNMENSLNLLKNIKNLL